MTPSGLSRIVESLADRSFTRRWLLSAGGVFIAATVSPLRPLTVMAQESDAIPTPGGTPASGAAIATTGQAVPELADFDDGMTGLVAEWGVPGGQLAVAKDGRLVFDRAY